MKMFLLVWLVISLWIPASAEEFFLEIDGHNVTVLNNGAQFNCGSEIGANLDLECGTVTLTELEDLIDPQYCTCPFDLIFDFTLAPGEYTLQVWRLEWWQDDPIMVWVTTFGIIEPGFLTEARVQQSTCGGWGPSSLPEGESEIRTWSAIRSLY